MSAQISNVLFVVKPGMSFKNSVRDSLQQLMEHQAQILGLVVNGVEDSAKPYNHRLNKQSAGDQYQTESNDSTTLWKLIKKKAVSCNLHKQFPPLTLIGSLGSWCNKHVHPMIFF